MSEIENELFIPNGGGGGKGAGTLVDNWPDFEIVGSITGACETQLVLSFAVAGTLVFDYEYSTRNPGQYGGYRLNDQSVDLGTETPTSGRVTVQVAVHQAIGFYVFSQSLPPMPATLRIKKVSFG